MKEKIDLSVIIVTYKSQDFIRGCIDSIYENLDGLVVETIISDNSPDEKTSKLIRSLAGKYPRLLFIKNKKNVGFSKGNNIGIKKATGKFVLFLNPDTKVGENTLTGMIKFLKNHEEAGAATCAVLLPNGKLDDSCHRGFPTPWRAFCHFSGLAKLFPGVSLFAGYNLTYLDFSKTHEIDSLAGSFMMMPLKVGEKLGWWDEDYFFYGEDLDFCYRIKKEGLKVYFVPKFNALHYKGLSSGIKKISKSQSSATKNTKRWATEQRFRAMEIFYEKHYKTKYPSFIKYLVFWGIGFKRKIAIKQNGL